MSLLIRNGQIITATESYRADIYCQDETITRIGSKAALFGGTTPLIEMICPARTEEPLAAFDLWKSKAVGQSDCDFTFHMGVSRCDSSTESQLKEFVKAGLSSFKIFLAYKGAFGVDDSELYQTLRVAKSLGIIVTAHCENADA